MWRHLTSRRAPDPSGSARRTRSEQPSGTTGVEVGLTQGKLAGLTSVNRTYLSELESGKGADQVKRVLRVLRQLGVQDDIAEGRSLVAGELTGRW
jgi:hypothetical protein